MKLIPHKGKVLRGSITLRLIELGFLITLFDLASAVLPELAPDDPNKKLWLMGGAAACQLAAWIGRFILQPKLSGGDDAGE